MKNDIMQIALTIIVLAILITGISSLNRYLNGKHERSCVASGGEYYRAFDSSRSFCKTLK